jgi:hypothetical protein
MKEFERIVFRIASKPKRRSRGAVLKQEIKVDSK